MSFKFDIPASWNRDPAPPPPDLSSVDPHRIESMVNRFIAAKQEALFIAPDAFYRQTGADAVDRAPALLDRLAGLRQSTLDLARDDNERALLGPRLDLHVDDARDGIDRHVSRQRDEFARRTIAARAAADPDLSPAEKASVLSKIAERTSATESARVAAVKGLDDKLDDATRALATAPATYKPATFLALANAYDDAGEPDKAAAARRLARQENILLRFARSSVEEQQHLIDVLPVDAQEAARAIQQQQSDAFAKDAFTAGTSLYPHVGAALPIEDIESRIEQSRKIAAARGEGAEVLPFTADEMATIRHVLAKDTPQEREAVLARLALPHVMEAQFIASLEPEDASTNQRGEVQLDSVGSGSETSAEMTNATRPMPALSLPVRDRVWTDGPPQQSGDPNLIRVADETDGPPSAPETEEDVEVAQAPSKTNPAGKPQTPTTNAPKPGATPIKPAPNPPANPVQARRLEQAATNRKEIDRLAGKPASDYSSEEPFPADWQKRPPQTTLDAVNREAKAFNVPPELLARIMWKESKFKERAGEEEGYSGQGIAGISNKWAAQQLWNNWLAAAQRDPNNGPKWGELEMAARRLLGNMRLEAAPAIRMEAEYLRYLYDKTGHSWPVAVAAYKHGETVISALLNGTTTPKSVPDWGQVQAYLGIVFDSDAKRFDAYK